MLTIELVFAVLFGLAFGSFLNVCISRLPRHASIALPPSHCPRCHAPIAARDNVPLVSFFLLRGRCRRCGWRIPWRYPFVEMATAILTAACVLDFGPTLNGCALAIFCTLLLALAVCDMETLLLPDTLTLPLLALGLVFRAISGYLAGRPLGFGEGSRQALATATRGALSAALAVAALWLVGWLYARVRHRTGMGLGDVKLAAAIATWVGARQMLVVFFLAVAAGAMTGAALLLLRRRRGFTWQEPQILPFGLFLAFAGIYCAFAGTATLDWYLGFFPS